MTAKMWIALIVVLMALTGAGSWYLGYHAGFNEKSEAMANEIVEKAEKKVADNPPMAALLRASHERAKAIAEKVKAQAATRP